MSRTQEKALGVSGWRLKQIARMYESGLSLNEISQQIKLSLSEVRKILDALGYK
jgi:DNA-binding IclR family transcriptional regulator